MYLRRIVSAILTLIFVWMLAWSVAVVWGALEFNALLDHLVKEQKAQIKKQTFKGARL